MLEHRAFVYGAPHGKDFEPLLTHLQVLEKRLSRYIRAKKTGDQSACYFCEKALISDVQGFADSRQ